MQTGSPVPVAPLRCTSVIQSFVTHFFFFFHCLSEGNSLCVTGWTSSDTNNNTQWSGRVALRSFKHELLWALDPSEALLARLRLYKATHHQHRDGCLAFLLGEGVSCQHLVCPACSLCVSQFFGSRQEAEVFTDPQIEFTWAVCERGRRDDANLRARDDI